MRRAKAVAATSAATCAGAAERFSLTIHPVEGSAGQPIHFCGSVPFASGELRNTDTVRLLDGANEIPCAVTMLNGWRDGSVRSALLQFDTCCPAEPKDLTVEFGERVKRRPWPSDVTVDIDPKTGGLLANTRMRLEFDTTGLKSIRCDLDGDNEPETELGRVRLAGIISGRGQSLDGSLDGVPARYAVVEETPRCVTVRQEQRWGAPEGRRWPYAFVIEYTLWADSDVLDLKAYLWITGAAAHKLREAMRRPEDRPHNTEANTTDWEIQRTTLELLPAFPAKSLKLGAGDAIESQPPPEDKEVFFSHTVPNGWQVVRPDGAVESGEGDTGQYVLYVGEDKALTAVFKDFDAWGVRKFKDVHFNDAFERCAWNAHMTIKRRYVAAGILDWPRDKRIGTDDTRCPHEAWAGQRWTWRVALQLTGDIGRSDQEALAFSRAVARTAPYSIPYERWIAARYLPERHTLPKGLLDWIEILAQQGDAQRWPGGPGYGFGVRPWHEPLLYNWMRHGHPGSLDAFLRLTEQNNLYETSYDPYGDETPEKTPRADSLDGMTFARARGPGGSSFYSNPSVALLAWLMCGEYDFLDAHDRQLWRMTLNVTPEGFAHDGIIGDPGNRKFKSQGRAGCICHYFFDEDQLRQAKYAQDRSWFDLAAHVYRYYADFAFSHEQGERGFIYWYAEPGGRTYEDGLAADYEDWKCLKPNTGTLPPVAWLRYFWMFFHWTHGHADYYELTGDDEILPYLKDFARVWADPRSTQRIEREERCFSTCPPFADAQSKVGGSVQALAMARYNDNPETLTIGKSLLALALSPVHLWRYPQNPNIHPTESRWYGNILGSNILPGSWKWGSPEHGDWAMIGASATKDQRLGRGLSVAVEMRNPFLFAHDLERYWYLDQGGKYAVVDDHSKPFDPTYYDKDNEFPNDEIINPATERVVDVTDIGTRATRIRIAADPGSTHHYWFWSPEMPDITVEGGAIVEKTYDAETEVGELTVKHDDSGDSVISISYARDDVPPAIRGAWVRTGAEPYFHADIGDYREVLTGLINPDIDYDAINRPHARVLTDQRTTAKLYYSDTPKEEDSWRVLTDDTLRFNHRFELDELQQGTWFIKFEVADDSGNRANDDNGGDYYRLVKEGTGHGSASSPRGPAPDSQCGGLKP